MTLLSSRRYLIIYFPPCKKVVSSLLPLRNNSSSFSFGNFTLIFMHLSYLSPVSQKDRFFSHTVSTCSMMPITLRCIIVSQACTVPSIITITDIRNIKQYFSMGSTFLSFLKSDFWFCFGGENHLVKKAMMSGINHPKRIPKFNRTQRIIIHFMGKTLRFGFCFNRIKYHKFIRLSSFGLILIQIYQLHNCNIIP